MVTLSQIVQRNIASDDLFQRELKPGVLDAALVADNMRSRAEFRKAVAGAILQFRMAVDQIPDSAVLSRVLESSENKLATETDSAPASYPQYPASQRIQISEDCRLVAKWLTQGIAPGSHWQLLRYDSDLGVLIFKIVNLS
ncbi:MAG: hypothetical protein ABI833_03405 [Acidobacteriota bacterium]